MATGDLDQLLIELEVATAALADASLDDCQKARAALKRRAKALSRIADLPPAALGPRERAVALRRLESVERAGEEALQRLRTSKRRAALEWSRWNQVLLALGAGDRGRRPSLDVRG
jgi:hypothetical protein